ncbi:uncharacterized protein [Osmerus mordax]|uniref:uncharacterized protein n=1 Tax=Osmerus mordax TaxID=8014 RepID=UPI0035109EE4
MDTADTFLGIMSFYRVLSLHHSMKTLTLIIILTLATEADGEEWAITVPKELNAALLSDVTIQCNFTHPPALSEDSVKVFWKIQGKINPEINEKDQHEFIYHPNNGWVKKSFQNRTTFTGNVRKKDCSLKIQNIQESDANSFLYMRLATGKNNYSFNKDLVTIKIKGVNVTRELPFTDSTLQFTSTTAMMTTEDTGQSTVVYVASIIPFVVVLIAITLGFIFFKHHKRHVTTITREPSGHYVNFSRANAEKTEISQKKEPIPLPPLKTTQSGPPKTTIDEPVYGNVLPHIDFMDLSVDETDNVYANVDCSKP